MTFELTSVSKLISEARAALESKEGGAIAILFLDGCEDGLQSSNKSFDDLINSWADDSVDVYYNRLNSWLAGEDGEYNPSYWMNYAVTDGLVFLDGHYDFYRHIQAAQRCYFEDCLYSNRDAIVQLTGLIHLLQSGVKEISTGDPLDTLENMDYSRFSRTGELFEQLDYFMFDESEEEE